jgi:hypothetical protein
MRKPTISFAIVSFSLLVLSGCNSANQNTYSAAAPAAATPGDARKAEIARMCQQNYGFSLLSGVSVAAAGNDRTNCLVQSGYFKD